MKFYEQCVHHCSRDCSRIRHVPACIGPFAISLTRYASSRATARDFVGQSAIRQQYFYMAVFNIFKTLRNSHAAIQGNFSKQKYVLRQRLNMLLPHCWRCEACNRYLFSVYLTTFAPRRVVSWSSDQIAGLWLRCIRLTDTVLRHKSYGAHVTSNEQHKTSEDNNAT